jgi:hypothetical protein
MPAKAKYTGPPPRFRYPIVTVTVTGQRQLRALSLYVQRVTEPTRIHAPARTVQNPIGMQQVIIRMPDRAISG